MRDKEHTDMKVLIGIEKKIYKERNYNAGCMAA